MFLLPEKICREDLDKLASFANYHLVIAWFQTDKDRTWLAFLWKHSH